MAKRTGDIELAGVLTTPAGAAASDDGEDLILTAGSGHVTAGAGGSVTITAGVGYDTDDGGDITLSAGANAGTGSQGAIVIPAIATGPTVTTNKLFNIAGALTWNGTDISAGGTVNISGTPANNRVAVWTDADTIEGSTRLIDDAGAGTFVCTTSVSAEFRNTNGILRIRDNNTPYTGNPRLEFEGGTSGGRLKGHVGFRSGTMALQSDQGVIDIVATQGNSDITLTPAGSGNVNIVNALFTGTGVPLQSVAISDLDNGTDGELITWDASGVATTVAVGTATHVLTSNGVGVAPTFQAAAAGGISNVVEDTTPQLGGNLDVNDFDIVGKPAADATSVGGDVVVKAADGGATSGAAGSATLSGGITNFSGSPVATLSTITVESNIDIVSRNGYGGGYSTPGGDINLTCGYGGVYCGSINLTGGDANGNRYGGSINLIAGAGGTHAYYGTGGDVLIRAGAEGALSTGVVRIQGGRGLTGGSVLITGGTNVAGPVIDHTGGSVTVIGSGGTRLGDGGSGVFRGGNAQIGNGGSAELSGGDADDGVGGNVNVYAGNSTFFGTGGDLSLSGGYSTLGTGGSVTIESGAGAPTGSDVIITPGAGSASPGYQVIDMGGAMRGASATGLANDATVYTASVVIDGGSSQPIAVTGSAAQTYTTLLIQINNDITGSALDATTNNIGVGGDFIIISDTTGASSTVAITDTDLFLTLTDYVAIDAAVPGAVGSAGAINITQTTAPTVTTDKLYNVSGALTWNGIDVTAAGGIMTEDSDSNIVAGTLAGSDLTPVFGDQNIIIGTRAGRALTTATASVVIGYEALTSASAASTGLRNIAIGSHAMNSSVITSANENVGIGSSSLSVITTAANNVAVGNGAGIKITTGAGNIMLGKSAGPTTNLSNGLFIHSSESNTPLIGGDFSTGLVTFNGAVRFTERADHIGTPAATFGELWVKSDTPNSLIFTDDAGTDYDLTAAGGGGDVSKVGTPVNNQIGVWTGDGTLEGDSQFIYDGTTMGIDVAGTTDRMTDTHIQFGAYANIAAKESMYFYCDSDNTGSGAFAWRTNTADFSVVDEDLMALSDSGVLEIGSGVHTGGLTLQNNAVLNIGANDLKIHAISNVPTIESKTGTSDDLTILNAQTSQHVVIKTRNSTNSANLTAARFGYQGEAGVHTKLMWSGGTRMETTAVGIAVTGDLAVSGNITGSVAQNTQTGTTYTAVLADAGKMITLDNAAAITMTIPANSSVAYPIGTKLNFMQLGAGQVTVAITTDTLNVESTLTLKLKAQYAVATAFKVTATTWVLFGNLEAV